MKKLLDNFLYTAWVFYAVVLAYIIWSGWPHSAPWIAAATWFVMYVLLYRWNMLSSELTMVILKGWKASNEEYEKRIAELVHEKEKGSEG